MSEPVPESSAEIKSNFFRRSALPRGWEYELPEGKLATPAQSAEFRRRRRRVGA